MLVAKKSRLFLHGQLALYDNPELFEPVPYIRMYSACHPCLRGEDRHTTSSIGNTINVTYAGIKVLCYPCIKTKNT